MFRLGQTRSCESLDGIFLIKDALNCAVYQFVSVKLNWKWLLIDI